MPPDLDARLAEIRDLTARFKAGRPDSFEAFRQLAVLLLGLTVLAPEGGLRLAAGPRGPGTLVLGGWGGPDDPLPLNDGRYLRLSVTLYREAVAGGHRLKVADSSYQYQFDRAGDRWVFRYDFLRTPPDPHPGAHLQIRGTVHEAECLPEDVPLERVHFPTGRIALEAVIRLLADQFGVPCHQAAGVWRSALAESERAFQEIAHRPASGPSR